MERDMESKMENRGREAVSEAYSGMKEVIDREMKAIEDSGLLKKEIVMSSPQGVEIDSNEGELLNFCANNYLGFANHPEIVEAAVAGLRQHGFGMSSVRFICGTQDLHKSLERRISGFLGFEDTILYGSCFDANAGLFETILGKEDAILSDALNHASIVDGVRLCRARREIYQHGDMSDLESKLKDTRDARIRMIATDGVFSMLGDLAPLPEICELAGRYRALVMLDDSHATGFVGATGRGTPEHFGLADRIDVLTSTLGKALGGASGGFTTGRKEIIALLRQRSRPYVFSNSLAPSIVAASHKAFELLEGSPHLVRRLHENASYFRTQIKNRGFPIVEGNHPIVPVMLGEERMTFRMARAINERGIFVVGFTYPIVPKGKARIRLQMSADHTRAQLDRVIGAFEEVGKEMGVI